MNRLLALACFLAFTVPFTSAQETKPKEKEEDKDDTAERLAFVIEEVKQEVQRAATNHLLIRVDAICAQFDLPDKTRKRLELAAKGAAKSLVEKQRHSGFKSILQRRGAVLNGQFELNGRVITPPNSKPEEGTFVPKIFIGMTSYGGWVQIREQRGGSGTSIAPGLTQLYQEKRWINERNKVLNPEQLKAFQSEQKKHLAIGCSAMLYGYLHGQLEFSKEQAPKVRQYLESHFIKNRDKLVRQDLAQPSLKVFADDARGLEKLLTPSQRKRWKDCQFQLKNRLPL